MRGPEPGCSEPPRYAYHHHHRWDILCSATTVADSMFRADPKYEEEVSGCTACVGLITDDKIYTVSFPSPSCPPQLPPAARPPLC